MALASVRVTFARTGAVRSTLGAVPVNPAAAAAPIQVAGLKATYGETYPYVSPFPYKEKHFYWFSQFFDNAKKRMCENSKIITVDGNFGVGKDEFAKRLAKEFDLQYIPAVPDKQCFDKDGYNLLELNQFLPEERMKLYDWEAFLKDKNYKRGFVGRLQVAWYVQKMQVYAYALQHLYHTGQGAVIVRSAFSDFVFAEAMRNCGYVTNNFINYYNMIVDNSICELHTPHLCIYLDTPVDLAMERFKKTASPAELASPAMDKNFFEAVDQVYKRRFLPKMNEKSEVMEIDWTEVADELDMDAIAVEIEKIRLDASDASDPRFQDWYNKSEDDLNWYRRRFGSTQFMMDYTMRPVPTDCDEILYDTADYDTMNDILMNHPAVKYAPGTAPELGHSRLWPKNNALKLRM